MPICRKCRPFAAFVLHDDCGAEVHVPQDLDLRLAELASNFGGTKLAIVRLIELQQAAELGHVAARRAVLVDEVIIYPFGEEEFADTLREIHGIVFPRTHFWFGGRFRRPGEPPVSFGRGPHERAGVHPDRIESELADLYRTFVAGMRDDLPRESVLYKAAGFLEGLFHVHPFHDGNGRVGRLFLHALLRPTRFLCPFFPEDANARRRYVKALVQAHRDGDVTREGRLPRRPRFGLLMKWLDESLFERIDLIDGDEAFPPEWAPEGADLPDASTAAPRSAGSADFEPE